MKPEVSLDGRKIIVWRSGGQVFDRIAYVDEIPELIAALHEALDRWEGWLLDQEYSGMDRAPFDRIAALREKFPKPESV